MGLTAPIFCLSLSLPPSAVGGAARTISVSGPSSLTSSPRKMLLFFFSLSWDLISFNHVVLSNLRERGEKEGFLEGWNS